MNNNREWIYGWGIRRALLGLEGSILRHTKLPRAFGNDTDTQIFATIKNGAVSVYYTSQVSKNREKFGKQFLNPSYFAKVLVASRHSRGNLKKWLKNLESIKYGSLSNAKLSRLLKEYFRNYLWIMTLFKLSNPEYLYPIEKKLKQILRREFGSESSQKYFEILTTPYKLDQISKERIEWLKRIIRKKPDTDFFLTHVSKYPWLVYNFLDIKQASKTLLQKYKSETAGERHVNPRKELERVFAKKAKIRRMQKRILAASKSDKLLLSYLSDVICDFSVERLELKVFYGLEPVQSLLREIAGRINVNFEFFLNLYRYQDMQNFLLREVRLSEVELKKRRLFMIMLLDSGHLKFQSGQEAKSLSTTYLLKNQFKKGKDVFLRGRIAQAGKISGTARIVVLDDRNMFTKTIRHFKQGDIIIASMTQPNLMHIVKKAGGIVTDEGGVASHAAIIAREFGIPCVIGTKIATKIFKNGDRVEVDANKGIVRKISK